MLKSNNKGVSSKMNKKIYFTGDNITQSGGSVLEAMQNLPGVTIQEGKINLRGNDNISVLIDGKQTALTGFGTQSGLNNIPSSAIEKIEIINNPSAKYDANGNGGIVNIIYKKSKKIGFTGKSSTIFGLGSLGVKKENYPSIRPQYQNTPKINQSIFINNKAEKSTSFLLLDNLYNESLYKNEFVTRTYKDGTIINQQTKRNRNTNFFTSKAGSDWEINEDNYLSISALYGSESIEDNGDEPFFNEDFSGRYRLWQFLEDEIKTTLMSSANYQHKFKEPGHILDFSYSYTFHREDEKYFFDDIYPSYTGKESFKLISDENVSDFTVDYSKPMKYGKLESGAKFRYRYIPTNMEFFPGENSIFDIDAGGWANYKEIIPALYGNYTFEDEKYEATIGLRAEYVDIDYQITPDHKTYESDGYTYIQPFPNLRLAYKINEQNKVSFFYNRRVDRPNEIDLRIFPKYDDAEIIKVGNPALQPQFTNLFELGYKTDWFDGDFFTALYHKTVDATITRINIEGSNRYIFGVFQNTGRSYNTGIEMVFNNKFVYWYKLNLNLNAYQNQLDKFVVNNKYPVDFTFAIEELKVISGNIKLNNNFKFGDDLSFQLTAIYLFPDIIPQGTIDFMWILD